MKFISCALIAIAGLLPAVAASDPNLRTDNDGIFNNHDVLQRQLGSECSDLDYSLPSQVQGTATQIFVAIILSLGVPVNLSETPIAIRIFSLLDASLWNCVASFDDTYQDALRRGQRPVIQVPESVCFDTVNPYTTDARGLCMVHVYAAAIPKLVPDAIDAFEGALESVNYPSIPLGLDPDIEECQQQEDYTAFAMCLQEVAEAAYYNPTVVASAIVADMLDYAMNNGWNMDGTNGGQCEYNCAPYSDTIGYSPRNIPQSPSGNNTSRKLKKTKSSIDEEKADDTAIDNRLATPSSSKITSSSKRSKQGEKKAKKTKKNKLDDTAKYWQPLLENDGRGFFYRQEHVTPHIGFTAIPRLFTREEFDSRELLDPHYDLVLEAELVTQRLQDLDDETKMLIEHFDNKSTVAGTLFASLFARYGASFTFERIMLWLAIFLAAEEDATVLVWKEKVRHDLVRPTTVIQQSSRYGTPEIITTWAGPGQRTETFAAKDFQPYIRVMPHAEYPSGSACICMAGADAMRAYMMTVFNDSLEGYTFSRRFDVGSSVVEPGMTPNAPIALNFESLNDFVDKCGQSRLDGGMHFTASIEAGYDLCTDFKPKVEEYILELLNGKDDLITTFTPPP